MVLDFAAFADLVGIETVVISRAWQKPVCVARVIEEFDVVPRMDAEVLVLLFGPLVMSVLRLSIRQSSAVHISNKITYIRVECQDAVIVLVNEAIAEHPHLFSRAGVCEDLDVAGPGLLRAWQEEERGFLQDTCVKQEMVCRLITELDDEIAIFEAQLAADLGLQLLLEL